MVADSKPHSRLCLVDRVDPRTAGAAVTWLVAPPGYRKSALLREVTARPSPSGARRAVTLSIVDCESHAGLFITALASGLRALQPGIDLRPLLSADPGGEDSGWLVAALAPLAQPELLLALDDVHALDSREDLSRAVAALIAAPPPGLRVLLAGRARPPALPNVGVELRRPDLELDDEEVLDHLARVAAQSGRERAPDAAVARYVREWTRGWPAAVDLVARELAASDGDPLGRARAISERGDAVREAVEELFTALRPESRYFAGVAALVDQFDAAWADGIFGFGAGAGGGPSAGSPEARRRLIRLGPEAVSQAIAQLVDGQLVTRVPGGLELSPACRAVLTRAFRARDPEGYQEANRRAAELLIARGEHDRLALYDHLAASGEHERLLTLLRPRAEGLLENGHDAALERWLEVIVGHYPAPPVWVDYLRGRVLGLRGAWDEARDHLERLRVHLDQGRADVEAWRWQPRLALGYGELWWRRGGLSEARTWSQRGIDFIDQATRRGRVPAEGAAEVADLRCALLVQLARVAADSATGARAREALTEALAHAREERHRHHLFALLADLAWNEARVGDVAACRRVVAEGEGLSLLDSPEVRAQLMAADALVGLTVGELTAGAARAREACELLGPGGDPVALTRVWIAQARVHAWVGDTARARDTQRAAVDFAQRAGRAGLLGEALDRLVTLDIAAGDVGAAASHHAAAEEALALILKLDCYLAAVHRETTGELRLAREASPRNGLAHLEAARDAFERFGADHDVARLHWRLAELDHGLAGAGHDEARADMLARLEDACAIAEERGYHLPDERSRQELAVIGSRFGEPEVVRYCTAMLGRLGVDVERPSASAEASLSGYGVLRSGPDGWAPAFRVITRDGVRRLDERSYIDAKAETGPALVVLVEEQAIVNFGKPIDLAQKRVMLPLLLTLLRAPDEAFSMQDLGARVWGGDDPSGSAMQTKVKVAISRLRTLLGKARKYIVTTRKDQGGESVAAYQLAPNLVYRVFERVRR